MVKDWKVKTNKHLEIQSDWYNGWTKILCFDIDIHSEDCDHPGWTFTFELCKLWFFQITYYDIRHQEEIENEITDTPTKK